MHEEGNSDFLNYKEIEKKACHNFIFSIQGYIKLGN
jgi:hypothetical protein